jgi:hypothetical protein
LQACRFYVPALGAISLLGAWPVVRVARRIVPALSPQTSGGGQDGASESDPLMLAE